jgi:hypothetical protein
MLEGKGLGRTRLPHYFYDLSAITDEHRPRWVDEFADPAPSVIQMRDMNPFFLKARSDRNVAYSKWIAAFSHTAPDGSLVPHLKPGLFKWQAIRVLEANHSETTRQDWWPNYRDCLFRVWLNPQTIYDQASGEHKQWYLLSPEDCYLVNRHEALAAGTSLDPREYSGREKYLSGERRLRRARLIPTECCHHLINEGQEYKEDL